MITITPNEKKKITFNYEVEYGKKLDKDEIFLFELFDQFFKVRIQPKTMQVELPPMTVAKGVYEFKVIRQTGNQVLFTGKAEVVNKKKKITVENKLKPKPTVELKIPPTPSQEVKQALKNETSISANVERSGQTRVGEILKRKKRKYFDYKITEDNFGKLFDYLLTVGESIPFSVIDDYHLEDLDLMLEEINIMTNLITDDIFLQEDEIIKDGFLFTSASSQQAKKKSAAWYAKASNRNKIKRSKEKIEYELLQRKRKKLAKSNLTTGMKRKKKYVAPKNHTNEKMALRRVLQKWD